MNGNNIRSPSYNFFTLWFLVFVIVFLSFVFNIIGASAFEEYNTSLTSYSYKDCTNSEFNSFLESIVNDKEYNYFLVYYSGLLNKTSLGDDQPVVALYYTKEDIKIDDNGYCLNNFFNSKFVSFSYWEYGRQWDCGFSSSSLSGSICLNKDITNYYCSGEGSCPNIYSGKNNNSIFRTLLSYRINNYSDGSNSIYDFGLVEKQYDKNDLNTYPVDTVNVVFPEEIIKTNSKYYTFAFKGKIKLEDSEIEESVTQQIISKSIRNKFRYDFKSDKENLTGLSCLGAFKIDKEDSFTDGFMLQNLLDGKIIFHNEKYDVTDFADDFVCGVSGNYKEWNIKGYYNFIVNTSVYVGDSPGANEYKFYFTVPYKFSGVFSYKTITVNYSFSRGLYFDENFDGFDDETTEVIPDSEIDIIYPNGFYPSFSTSTPSNNTFNDGDVIQNNNNNVYLNDGFSKEEQNGILNLIDGGLRATNGRFRSLNESFSGFRNTMSGIFSFFPQDVQNILFLSIILMAVFFIFGLRR